MYDVLVLRYRSVGVSSLWFVCIAVLLSLWHIYSYVVDCASQNIPAVMCLCMWQSCFVSSFLCLNILFEVLISGKY